MINFIGHLKKVQNVNIMLLFVRTLDVGINPLTNYKTIAIKVRRTENILHQELI